MSCAYPIRLWRWRVRRGCGCRLSVPYATSHDVREVRVVFDGGASVFAVVWRVLMGAAFYSRRRQPRSESGWSKPVDRG